MQGGVNMFMLLLVPHTCHQSLSTGEAEAIKAVLPEPEPETVDNELPCDCMPTVEHPWRSEVDGRVNAS